MTENSNATFKWRHPNEVMQLHQLKKKKKALQARINASSSSSLKGNTNIAFNDALASTKRKNPFLANSDNKKPKTEVPILSDESTDQTLFKLLHLSTPKSESNENLVSFDNILHKTEVLHNRDDCINREEIKVTGEKWVPIDWTLKTKLRLLSSKPIAWNQKLKISEEASGITSFTRCLDTSSTTSSLDTSPNAKFHQCCLYWQQPSLPWLNLFPRTSVKSNPGIPSSLALRDSLHIAWTDGLRSLFQLIRTKQCPFFYVCANNFTVLFRGAGICGFTEMHALVTPTTRGFRHSLRQEEIEFTMPLKNKRKSETLEVQSDQNTEHDEDEDYDENWMESMGINSEDIKQINYTQERLNQKAESQVDDSEQSLLLIEGLEVQALYSFLINCKSAVVQTGTYAGIPPTLLAPVAFNGATLMALKVRESKVHLDNEDYYSLDLTGPILPHTIHNLCAIHPTENSMTATFSNYNSSVPFSKVLYKAEDTSKDDLEASSAVFRKENLSDCGLMPKILKHFCSDNPKVVCNVECLKYTAETNSYAWT